MKNKLLTILFIFILHTVNSQIPLKSWRDHLPHSTVKYISFSDTRIYAITPLSIFYINKSDHSIEKINKVNGLSDIGISTAEYSKENDLLLIAYNNSNIDIIKNNIVYNIPDFKNKQMQGSKKIYKILFHGKKALLACGFGILEVNLEKFEIGDAYYIGNNAISLNVFDLEENDGYFYAATNSGIYKADANSQNLINYSEWILQTDVPAYNQSFSQIEFFNNMMFVNYYYVNDYNSVIFYKNDNSWYKLVDTIPAIKSLKSNKDYLTVVSYDLYTVDKNLNITKRGLKEKGYSPNFAICDENNLLWIGDNYYAVYNTTDFIELNGFYADGPFNEHSVDMSLINGRLAVAGGAKQAALYITIELYQFYQNQWRNNVLWNRGHDLSTVTINPYNTKQVVGGSWNTGVFVFNEFDLDTVYNETNSTLQSQIPGAPYMRIAGIVFDKNKNMWVSNFGVYNPVSVKTNDGKWYCYNFSGQLINARMGEMICTQSNTKWAIISRYGLCAFNDKGTLENTGDDDFVKFPFEMNTDLGVLSAEVMVIEEDLNGTLWCGTNKGIGVFYYPDDIFTRANHYAEPIKITGRIGDTTTTQYLMSNETVTAIAVDGANRKWIGTERNGVFLVSEDGTEEILHFTAENSPLFSNTISCIAIDHSTGEVFIGTSQGIISYRSDATLGTEEFGDLYIFPNPVKEDYSGIITITGLVNNASVKITDISGQLIYETKANGSMATWDGKNNSGKRVKTGVYFAFCSNNDGSVSKVAKLLFIN